MILLIGQHLTSLAVFFAADVKAQEGLKTGQHITK
jgi:hypothetical protein